MSKRFRVEYYALDTWILEREEDKKADAIFIAQHLEKMIKPVRIIDTTTNTRVAFKVLHGST